MLKYLIQVVEQSLGVAIILAALSALLVIVGNKSRRPFIGCAVGAAAAFVLAMLRHETNWINREYFNIASFIAAIAAEIIIFILLSGRVDKADRIDKTAEVDKAGETDKRKPAVQAKRLGAVFAILSGVLLFYCLPEIFLYPTEFVLAGESAFSTDFLYKLIGFLAGALIVFISALALYRVGSRLPYRVMRAVVIAALAVNMVSQIAGIVQPLLARRIIPMEKWIFETVVFVSNHATLFLYAIMAVAAVTPVLAWRESLRTGGPFANPAQRRKADASARARRRWCALVAVGYVLAVVSLTAVRAYDEQEVVLSPAEPMEIAGSEIIIPLDDVNDGHLHRFAYDTQSGVETRFIVIKKSETTYGVGLDACDICGATGYYERKGDVICKLCDVVMNTSTIGFSGGCNPVPLEYAVREGNMVVNIADLEKEESRFE
ncbi:MAG: Fe-S-containing protein [Clostridiales Family XIII bacterium]|nr:Fe-S-containing protein [Clostridiales Family XIII bacterium]